MSGDKGAFDDEMN